MPKQLRLISLFSPSTTNICLCFWCSRCSGYGLRRNVRWAGIFFVLVLFSSCVHHLLECPGFICLGFTWYLLVVVLMLPIPQHGVFKDLPSFVTICTLQGLVVKVTCMQDCRRRISPACIGRDLPLQLSTVFCAPPGSTRKHWHYCLASAWLFPCCLC